MEFSVVIPAYNESKRIRHALTRIASYMEYKKYGYEIIVVDDGSADDTREIVKGFNNKKIVLIRNERNMGKGFSVRRGMLAAKKDYVLFSDADLSAPIEELEKFIPFIKSHEIIIGSRNLKGSDIQIKQPFIRSKLGRAFPFLVNLALLKDIKDTQCGFKLFRKEVIEPVFEKQTINSFCFDVEILFIARKFGLGIKEIPIVWANSLGSKVRAIADSYLMFRDVIKIVYQDRKGCYETYR